MPALLWSTHAGQETGRAVADVLFGDVSPSGRLTQTWYASDADLPPMLDFDIARSGHTYQYFRGTPLFALRPRAELHQLRVRQHAAERRPRSTPRPGR